MTSGYVTSNRLDRVINLPVAVPQTELKAGKNLLVGSVTLDLGQHVEVRSLTLKIVKVLTVGVLPDLAYNAYGLCVVGLFAAGSDCTPLAFAACSGSVPKTTNPFRRAIITGPGTWNLIVRNLTSNVDLAVTATGSLKRHG